MITNTELDIAVVGLSCRLPGANNVGEFWRNLIDGVNSIQRIPVERWDSQEFPNSQGQWCGLLDDVDKFDHRFFSISELEAKSMDPQQRLLLQEAWHCIEDSAISLKELQTRVTAVYVGAMTSDYLLKTSRSLQQRNRFQILGNDHCILANRISHQLNLNGESISINAASASSLVAIHKAKQALQANDCDYALVAGVNLNLDPFKYEVFSQANMLSPNGQCHSFSGDANGYVPGDGLAVILLTKLSIAERNQQQIYGIIKGSAVNHIGAQEHITAPDQSAQVEVITKALHNACVSVKDINYVETHGSGTPLGDPVEAAALSQVFNNNKPSDNGPIILGSVKPNIGHLEAAAGIAGFVKALLILKNRLVPKNINFSHLNPMVEFEENNLALATRNCKLTQPESLFAGISAFGFGGINCHLILQEYRHNTPALSASETLSSPEILPFVLSAKTKSSLHEIKNNWVSYFKSNQADLSAICKNLLLGREEFEFRIGYFASSVDELQHKLEATSHHNTSQRSYEDYALIFSLRHECLLYQKIPCVKQRFNQIITSLIGRRYVEGHKYQGVLKNRNLLRTVQSLSVYEALRDVGVPIKLVGAHTNGIWPALIACQVLTLDEYIDIVVGHKNISQVEYNYPDRKLLFSDEQLEPQLLNHEYISHLVQYCSKQEVSLRKLLKRCIEISAKDSDFSSLLLTWNLKPLGLQQSLDGLKELIKAPSLTQSRQLAHLYISLMCVLRQHLKRWALTRAYLKTNEFTRGLIWLLENDLLPHNELALFLDGNYSLDELNRIVDANCNTKTRQYFRYQNWARYDLEYQAKILQVIELCERPLSLPTSMSIINIGNNPEFSEHQTFQLDDRQRWLELLLHSWTKGHSIDWELALKINAYHKLSLPKYPFEKHSFWLNYSQDSRASISKIKFTEDEIGQDLSKPSLSEKTLSNKNKGEVDLLEFDQKIVRIISDIVGVEFNSLDTSKEFSQYGFDSVAYIRLCNEINKLFALSLTPAFFYGTNSIVALVDKLSIKVGVENSRPFQEPRETDKNVYNITQDVAIIGMAGVLPKASNLHEFWTNLINNKDCISEIPASRWRWQDYHSEDISADNKSPSKWGGFIPDIEQFDAAFFGITPTEAKLMDPQQRILMQCVWHALEHAGYAPDTIAGSNASVFMGVSTSDYEELIREQGLEAHASTGMNRSIIANRISYLLNIHGPSEVIDTACSSSLVALDAGVNAIRTRKSELIIAGGVNALITPTHFISYGKAGMLSADGRCKTYDEKANGYVRGEGAGVVILKSLAHAINQGDSIYGVIKSIGVNHGGKANALTAPNPNAQSQLIYQVYTQAGISPNSVSYFESHGTGTPLGDPIEIDAINNAFARVDSASGNQKHCSIASVKSNIGHLEAAAGVAGVLKILLAFSHQKLPATLNYSKVNPYLDLSNSCLEILDRNKDWPQGSHEVPRRASVSSFGFGGVNAHAILEEYISDVVPVTGDSLDDYDLLILSARTPAALHNYAHNLLDFLTEIAPNLRLRDIIYTLKVGRRAERYRLVICTNTIKQALECLKKFTSKVDDLFILDNVSWVNHKTEIVWPIKNKLLNAELQRSALTWLQGRQVSWCEGKSLSGLTRIALPGYPFETKSFWVKDFVSKSGKPTEEKNHRDKNILLKTQKTMPEQTLVKLSNDEFYAQQHLVQGDKLLPGVFYLDMISRKLGVNLKSTSIKFNNTCFLSPLVFDEVEKRVKINLIEKSDGIDVEIKGDEKPEGAQLLLSTKVKFSNQEELPETQLSGFDGKTAKTGEEVYTQLKAIGFDYKESFQAIQLIYCDSNSFVSLLSLPKQRKRDYKHFLLHPSLVDGALQSCLASNLQFDDSSCYIPMLIDDICFFRPIEKSLYVNVRQHKLASQQVDVISFDVELFNIKKKLVAIFKGVLFKKMAPRKAPEVKEETKEQNPVPKLRLKYPDREADADQSVQITNSNLQSSIESMERNSVSHPSLLTKTIEYFVNVVSEASAIEESSIDVTQPFKEYGIDSFLTLSIVRNLEKDFGELRKTLMFEATTIEELAQLFISEQSTKLLSVLGIDDAKKIEAVKDEEAPFEESPTVQAVSNPPSRTGRLGIQDDLVKNNVVKNEIKNEAKLFDDYQLVQMPEENLLVNELIAKYGAESVALSRKSIAPKIFLNSNRKSFFYLNINNSLLLAFRYVGAERDFSFALKELNEFASAKALSVNVLTEAKLEQCESIGFSATSFGSVQRIPEISSFSIAGGKMRRLRYHLNKFSESGNSETIEYQSGSDGQTDDCIASMIEKWAASKAGVNPYIWRVKEEMETGCLSEHYRMFLTYLDANLQNVIIISRIDSDHSYLLDTEFYSNEMVSGALEYAIVEIIKILAKEGSRNFSLGLTFGGDFHSSLKPDLEVERALSKLKEQKIFNESGNFQFKNKFRSLNSPLYLYRSLGQDSANITDIIMMIGNPQPSSTDSEITSNSGISQIDAFEEKSRAEFSNQKTVTLAKDKMSEVKSVPPQTNASVKLEKLASRQKTLANAGYNPYNLSRGDIEFDLATDSWSELEAAFITRRIQQLYAKAGDEQELEVLIQNIFELPYILPFSAGRVAESFFCKAWDSSKNHVIQNVLFPTCLYHQVTNDFIPIENTHSEFSNVSSNHLFKGDVDCELLEEQLVEFQQDIAFVWIELANNAAGGCPVSLRNLREIRSIIGDIPLVLDATRIIENAVFISEYEEGYIGQDVWSIVKEICQYADAINASLTKDFGTHCGGFIATRDPLLYENINDEIATSGSGLSRADRNLISQALIDRKFIEDHVKKRMELTSQLGKTLSGAGLRIVQPVGGHCLLIDPVEFKQAQLKYPLQSFLSWLFEATGIRAGLHSVGRQVGTSMNDLVRLAIPVGLTQSSIETISQRLLAAFRSGKQVCDLLLDKKSNGLFGHLKASYKVSSKLSLATSADNDTDDIPNSQLNEGFGNNEQNQAAQVREVITHRNSDPIAVIGMSGRYPDAKDLQEFWQNLVSSRNSIEQGPDWQSRFIDSTNPKHWGGFIDDVDKFDSLFFSISPREAENMDPQERLFMETAWHALEDAGYHPVGLVETLGSKDIGIFVGAVWSYYEMLGAENRLQGGAAIASSQHWGISNRVSSFMNFNGPSLTVDTACSSSLMALHLACESITNGESRAAIVGGVNLDLHPSKYHITEAAQFLSKDGLCRAFGKGGSGYVAGEGVGALLLKPLSLAEKDGDNIYGLIKSTSTNHGGRTSGYTVPSPNAQADLIKTAIDKAGVDAKSIRYLEAHGTGTELGDPIEIEGVSKAFRKYTQDKQFCAVGSVKTNIGHLEAAAGIAGATKLLLQMTHRKLVPSLHADELNEHIDFDNSPFYVQRKLQDWLPSYVEGKRVPRRASLSSFGAGGTNVHVIFEEYSQQAKSLMGPKKEIFVLSARKTEQLKESATRLANHLKERNVSLSSLAYTLKNGRQPMAKRLAIVAESTQELVEKLTQFVSDKASKDIYVHSNEGKLSLELFSGNELEQVLQVFIKNNSLDKLARLWVNGLNIKWHLLNEASQPQRISLPGYPFSKVTHWIAKDYSPTQINAYQHDSNVLHPLIDRNISSFNQARFSKKFNLAQYEFSEHIVNSLPTLPGVAYIEMALAASSIALEQEVVQLNNLIWASPINSEGGKDICIDLVKNSDKVNYEISTSLQDQKQVHAQGKVSFLELRELSQTKVDLAQIKSRCNQVVPKKACYELLKTRHLTYGDSLQTIEKFNYADKEGLTTIQLPNSLVAKFNQYRAHPAILDGAVQSIICLLEYCQAETIPEVPYVPFVLKELQFLRTLTTRCYAHLALIETSNSRQDIKLININLLDEEGNLLVKMNGFSFKAVEGGSVVDSSSQNKSFSEISEKLAEAVLYSPIWRDTQNTQLATVKPNMKYVTVVFCQSSDIAGEINQLEIAPGELIFVTPAETFKKISDAEYQICPHKEDDYQNLVSNILSDKKVPAAWLHHWCCEDYVDEVHFSVNANQLAIYSVVNLLKILLRNKRDIGVKQLSLIYSYQQDELLSFNHPLYSAVNGCLLSSKQEGANIQCKSLRTSKSHYESSPSTYWKQVFNEFSEFESNEVALVGSHRYVREIMQNSPQSQLASEQPMAKQGGVYLITGGAGGLGKLFAEEILTAQNTTVILTGRSDLSENLQKTLAALCTNSSKAIYKSCDVTDANHVRVLIHWVIEKYGKIDGIIHSAGVIEDGFIWNKSLTQFERVLAPKMKATYLLDQATASFSLDYFVLCSSIASIVGNMGQSDYATANRFMDEFASYRNYLAATNKRHGKTLSINWPLWRNGGMSVNEQSEKWLFDNWGMSPLETELGLFAFKYGLTTNYSSFGLVTGDKNKIQSTLGLKKVNSNSDDKQKTFTLKEAESKSLVQNLNVSDYRGHLNQDLTKMVIDLLKISESDIAFEENMSHFGFDSVTFTEFANLINQRLELEITPLIFFEQETLQQLADYLIEDFSNDLKNHYEIEATETQQTEGVQIDTEQAQILHKNTDSTIEAAKHHRVDELSAENIAFDFEQESTSQLRLKHEPIAIVGMSGIMPQSKDLDTFWQNLLDEKNLVSEIPSDRWNWKKYWGESDIGNSKTQIKWGGFIPEVDKFDAEFFNISPLEAELTDPQQRLFLQTVWHTIEDAGYQASELNGSNTGVFVGIGTSDYHELLREQNSDFEAYSVMGWMHAVLANRISYFFNWSGPSEPIGTACSSSLVAIDRAVQTIRSGRCELCVAGGISLLINPGLHIGLGKAEMLSSDGRCKTFDHRANGYVRSEGTGAILLKPLSRAIEDNDNIYAVIKGSAVNHGGHVNTFTTPNPKAQTEVISMALEDADIEPSTLSYIEAHGTGTALGDPIEIQGLLKVFKNKSSTSTSEPERFNYCSLGSVKTNVGHLELAAGMAGMFKLALALKNKKIPASINFEKVNPYIQLENTPFNLVTQTQDWEIPLDSQGNPLPRRAGISSFGFGGVNAHIILEEYPIVEDDNKTSALAGGYPSGVYVIPISTKYQQGLTTYARSLIEFIDLHKRRDSLPLLHELASVMQFGRTEFKHRIAVVCDSYDTFKLALEAYLSGDAKQPNLTFLDAKNSQNLEETSLIRSVREWTAGESIDWNQHTTRLKKISAPTYPFKREKFWLLNDELRGVSNQEQKKKQENVSENKTDTLFISDSSISLVKSSLFGADKEAYELKIENTSQYIKDHRIGGENLLPAATYIEIASAVIAHEYGQDVNKMTELMWVKPILHKGKMARVLLELDAKDETVEFSFFSKDKGTTEYYCQGNALLGESNTLEHRPPLGDRLDVPFSVQSKSSIYEKFDTLGFSYGQSLQMIASIGKLDDSIIARLEISDSTIERTNNNPFNTPIIDCVLQSILGIPLLLDKTDKIRVPVLASSIELMATFTPKLTVKVTPNASSSGLESNVLSIFDISVYNEHSQVCMLVQGVEIRPLILRQGQVSDDSSLRRGVSELNEKNENLFQATTNLLKTLLANETKRSVSEIELDSDFDNYGIDSFLALRMTKKLEKKIGALSKSSFFDHRNISSLADYLCEEYRETLSKLFSIDVNLPETSHLQDSFHKQEQGQGQAQAPESASSSSHTDTDIEARNPKLLQFLKELIAVETKRHFDSIEASTSFDSYGIDSFLALRMTKKLESKIGSISKSSFFEYQNLDELVEYLCKQHAESVSKSFPVSALNKEVAIDGDKHGEVSQLLVDYVKELLAKETKRNKSEISDAAEFSDLGVDSFLALRMTKKLENAIGSISKSAFFEQSNLVEFSDYLIKNHHQAIKAFFASSLIATNSDSEGEGERSTNSYRVIAESELIHDTNLCTRVNELLEQYGMENKALARQTIAPKLFVNSHRNAYFNFNDKDGVALAFTYVGEEANFEITCSEFVDYCNNKKLEANVLSELGDKLSQDSPLSANPFGVMQRVTDVKSISLTGSRMRRLRYQISKFQNNGDCQCIEYFNGSDPKVDKNITSLIDRWCSNKNMVNPYINSVKAQIVRGTLASDYRIFLTYLDKQLQNVVIITPMACKQGYLMDLEFYPPEMPLGGLEYAIWHILLTLQDENSEMFSMGATFGVLDGLRSNAKQEVMDTLQDLQSQGVFDGNGNFQFKNKFRPDNSVLYLVRPSDYDALKITDVLMLIASPETETLEVDMNTAK